MAAQRRLDGLVQPLAPHVDHQHTFEIGHFIENGHRIANHGRAEIGPLRHLPQLEIGHVDVVIGANGLFEEAPVGLIGNEQAPGVLVDPLRLDRLALLHLDQGMAVPIDETQCLDGWHRMLVVEKELLEPVGIAGIFGMAGIGCDAGEFPHGRNPRQPPRNGLLVVEDQLNLAGHLVQRAMHLGTGAGRDFLLHLIDDPEQQDQQRYAAEQGEDDEELVAKLHG